MQKSHSTVQNIMHETLSKTPPSERGLPYPRNYKIKGEDKKLNAPLVVLAFLIIYVVMQLIGGN